METVRALFAKPDPNAQFRKCNALIRTNIRKLDRDIASVKQVEIKAKNFIKASASRAQRDPNRAQQAQKEVRSFANELVRARKASARLATSRAQLCSVQMQVTEAQAMRKIEGSIRASVGVMKDMNALIRLPQYHQTMQELSVELMKAGIMEEMAEEAMPEDMSDVLEDEAAEEEVDKVLGEIFREKTTTAKLPSTPLTPAPQKDAVEEEEEEEENAEEMMDQMRNRLEALRS